MIKFGQVPYFVVVVSGAHASTLFAYGNDDTVRQMEAAGGYDIVRMSAYQ